MINEKALFIGPFGENQDSFKENINSILNDVIQWRRNFHPFDPKLVSAIEKRGEDFVATQDTISEKLEQLLSEMKQSVPFHSPRFLGHMHSDLAIPALLGYITGLLYNQNNVVGESSPISTRKEIEFCTRMCKMIGYTPFSIHPSDDELSSWGHICSGGTTANIEAVWVARNMKYFPISLKLISDKVCLKNVALDDDIVKVISETTTNNKAIADLCYSELFNLSTNEISLLYADVLKNLKASVRITEADKICSKYIELFKYYDIRSLGVAGIHQAIPHEKMEFPKLIVSSAGHYSWDKCLDIVGIGNSNVIRFEVDEEFRLNTEKFDQFFSANPNTPILMVVGIVGTTEEGAIDEIHRMNEILLEKQIGCYFHIDGAYGGYFSSCIRPSGDDDLNNGYKEKYIRYLSKIEKDILAINQADSIAIDPHKLGYVPYAAGSIFYKNSFYKNFIFKSAPYLAQSSNSDALEKTYLGGWTLEGSRPGAAALACALSTEVIPLDYSGYGSILSKTIALSSQFYEYLLAYEDTEIKIVPIYKPHTNIVCYVISAPEYISKAEYVNLFTSAISKAMTIVPENIVHNYQFVSSQTDLQYSKYKEHIDRVLNSLKISYNEINDSFKLEFLRTVIMHPNIDNYNVNVWENNTNLKIPLFQALIKEISKISKSVLPNVLLEIISKNRNGRRIKLLWIENKESYSKHHTNLLFERISALPQIGKYFEIEFYDFTSEFNSKVGLEAINEITKNKQFDFSIIDLNLADNEHIEWESGISVLNYLYPKQKYNDTFGYPILYSKFFDDAHTKRSFTNFIKPNSDLFPQLKWQMIGKGISNEGNIVKQEEKSLVNLIKSIFQLLQKK